MAPKQLISAVLVIAATATAFGVFVRHHRADSKAQRVEQRASENEAEIVTKEALDADEDNKLTRRKALRKFPEDIDYLLKCLSNWGYWAPGETSIEDGRFSMTNARHEGNRPAKHSYQSLENAGALADSARGYLTLYVILATEADKERGRRADGGIRISVIGEQSELSYQGDDLGEVFTTSDAARKTLEDLQELQEILREYRTELIAEGFLAE